MPVIQQVTSFKVFGKTFKNTHDIEVHIENSIGAILDKVSPRLPPKQAIQVLKLIIDNREELTELLNVKIDVSENLIFEDLRNVLDYKADYK